MGNNCGCNCGTGEEDKMAESNCMVNRGNKKQQSKDRDDAMDFSDPNDSRSHLY